MNAQKLARLMPRELPNGFFENRVYEMVQVGDMWVEETEAEEIEAYRKRPERLVKRSGKFVAPLFEDSV